MGTTTENVVAEQPKQRRRDADGGRDEGRTDAATHRSRIGHPAGRQRVEGLHDAKNGPQQPEQRSCRDYRVQHPKTSAGLLVDADKERRGDVLLALTGCPVTDEVGVALHGASCRIGPLEDTHALHGLPASALDDSRQASHAPADVAQVNAALEYDVDKQGNAAVENIESEIVEQ